MEENQEKKPAKRSLGGRILRIVKRVLVGIFLLMLVLFLLILTAPVQNFIKGKLTNYLEDKLGTRVELGRVYVRLNGELAVDDLYFEDQHQDTLLAARKIRASVNLWGLIRGEDPDISSVYMEGTRIRVHRRQPDTVFNYQYIIDAFASAPDTNTAGSSSSGPGLKLGKIDLADLHVSYADYFSGDDLDLSWEYFRTDLTSMALDKASYAAGPSILRGLNGSYTRHRPTIISTGETTTSAETSAEPVSAVPIQILLSDLLLENAKVSYTDSVAAIYAAINGNRLRIRGLKLEPTQERYLVETISLNDTRLQYDDLLAAPQSRGIDYAHLDSRVETLLLNRFYMMGDSLAGQIKQLALTEQSGFQIKRLSTDFSYGPKAARLQNLDIQTPGSRISRELELSYPSIDILSSSPELLLAKIDLRNTRIAVKDILYFAPDLSSQPLFSAATSSWSLNMQATGTVNELFLEKMQLQGPEQLKAELSGHLKNVLNWQQLQADLNIAEISASKAALKSLIPADQLPEAIELPLLSKLKGTIKGGPSKMDFNLELAADQGLVKLKGWVEDLPYPERTLYNISTDIRQIDLAYLLKDSLSYGDVSGHFDLNGQGTDLNSLRAGLSGELTHLNLMGYSYTNWPLNASIQQQVLQFATSLKDPNLHFNVEGKMDLRQEYPGLQIDAFIDSARLQPLGLSTDPWIVRTGIKADFQNLDPDALDGQLTLQQLLLVNERERLQLEEVRLDAGSADSSRYLRLRSEIAQVDLEGNYQLTRLGDVLSKEIEPYYSLGVVAGDPGDYDFTLNATVTDRPLLRSLVPGLELARGVNLQSHFSSTNPLQANFRADELRYEDMYLKGLHFVATPNDSALQVNLRLARLESGSLQVDSSFFNARVANNQIDWDALIRDRQGRDRYRFAAVLDQGNSHEMVLRMKPQRLILNYEDWQMSDSNRIVVEPAGIWARDFELRKGTELLRLHSPEAGPQSPLHVSLKDFHASSLTALVLDDSSMVDGVLTGEVDLRNLTTNPVFTGELNWKDLSYHRDTVGNLSARFSNAGRSSLIKAELKLDGRGNDVVINGNYDADRAELDLQMNVDRLPMKTAEAFAAGSIRNTSGYLNGPFRITGPVAAPEIKGNLRFNNVGLNVSMLNSYFTVDQQAIAFTGEGLRFNNFQVQDSTGNNLTLDGNLLTSDYLDYRFDLDIRARNFQALNSTKKDNKLFWGQLFFNTNLKLEGTSAKPVLDGRITVNDKTKMTVLLPQSEPGLVDRAGVIEFVDMDAPVNDSLFLAAYDSLNMSELTGMDVSLNITIDKGADFTLIIDEGNGDFLNVKGEAQLNAGIDPSGKITMVGTYDLDQGAYELSFNMLRKKFNIQKGSRIVWEGEPTKANVDITAKYVANTAPLDLVKGQLDENLTVQERNMYLQQLPFEVNLRMLGELMKPQISFDIILPENKNYAVSNDVTANVRTKLEQLRQSAGDMNKQVFSLLLLNRFVAENPFSSLASGSNASTILRQSVSKLLTEQLNRLADGLIEGVDINLGIESKDDYSTGEKQERTDLTVGLSKSLLNDRLTVSVGSNFALEGAQEGNQEANNIAGNVAIDYALSRDGRYKLRAYRKNDYQGVIDGYVVETGLSFIITLDYNKFVQIFQKRRRPESSTAPKSSSDSSLKEEEKKSSTDPKGEQKEP